MPIVIEAERMKIETNEAIWIQNVCVCVRALKCAVCAAKQARYQTISSIQKRNSKCMLLFAKMRDVGMRELHSRT